MRCTCTANVTWCVYHPYFLSQIHAFQSDTGKVSQTFYPINIPSNEEENMYDNEEDNW